MRTRLTSSNPAPPALPNGSSPRANWKQDLDKRKENRTWWLVKLDFKKHPKLYEWLCAQAGEYNVSVAKLCKTILKDAQEHEKVEVR